MSKNRNDDWDSILRGVQKASEQSEPKRKGLQLNGLFMVAAISAFTGLMIMTINRIMISAWPNMDWIDPGIGFWDAFKMSLCIWALLSLKALVNAASAVAAKKDN
tara:strand:- start:1249 stop:1563 length:315 start_codon:yes stop_codon:yes gene_type:complete